ncbi:MAG: hypothetical protein ABIN01_17395 [Ferruginibacter sp.]
MSKFSFDKDMRLEVKARFIARGEDAPVTGDGYVVRLYDKDVFGDDYLGESKLNEAGEANIICQKDLGNALTLDIMPDFYFVLYKDKVPVFQSKVMEDIDLQKIENYQPGEGEVVDLGTFLIDA